VHSAVKQPAKDGPMNNVRVDDTHLCSKSDKEGASAFDYAMRSHANTTRLETNELKSDTVNCKPMPKPEEDLINRLTTRPEVREKAHALLHNVHSKTGPGTGYDIGDAKSGLPAICAYLASKRYAYLRVLFS